MITLAGLSNFVAYIDGTLAAIVSIVVGVIAAFKAERSSVYTVVMLLIAGVVVTMSLALPSSVTNMPFVEGVVVALAFKLALTVVIVGEIHCLYVLGVFSRRSTQQ